MDKHGLWRVVSSNTQFNRTENSDVNYPNLTFFSAPTQYALIRKAVPKEL